MRIRMVLVCVATGLLLSWGAFAQSMMEYAGAAAGGSIGGVAGKKVSDGLSKILDKVDKQTGEAAKTPPAETKNKLKEAIEKAAAGKKSGPPAVAEVTPAAPKGSPAPAFRPRWVGPKPPPETQAQTETAAALAEPAPAPPPPPPPAEEIGKIAPGTSRSDLLARAGAPASRISIPDDEGMLEIYHYRGGQSGTVRLRNGVVSEVRVEGK